MYERTVYSAMGIFYVVCILRYEAASPPELKHPGTTLVGLGRSKEVSGACRVWAGDNHP